MKAVFKKNRADETRRIAFAEVPNFGTINLYPDRNEDASELLGDCNVMITKILRREDGSVKCAFIRRIREDDVPVVFDGFEISGMDCSTSAHFYEVDSMLWFRQSPTEVLKVAKKEARTHGTVYPGLLLGDLITADNVNPPRNEVRTPGFGWIERYSKNGTVRWRLAGVESFDFIQLKESRR